MHILLVADGRSPITRRWVQGLLAIKHEISLVSTFPCAEIPDVREMYILPIAFAGLGGSQVGDHEDFYPILGKLRQVVSQFRSFFLAGRYFFGPLTLLFYARQFRRLVGKVKPDIIHALRIPFEGMLASFTSSNIPLVVSVWGNDLTLHGRGSRWMRSLTARTLSRANGLLADTKRDLRIAHQWGFPADRPYMVLPGGGGINLVEINHVRTGIVDYSIDALPNDAPLVVNPRGFRPGSIRNDVFFRAIPLVLERLPNVFFICPAMAEQKRALRWVQRLNLKGHVRLLPFLPQEQLWKLFTQAEISVSISTHDGTPNSLLEAMACGCFPIAGDIESLREWIVPGVNGMLVEPEKPQALAEALILALTNPALRNSAAEYNLRMIRERTEVRFVRSQMVIFYRRL